MAKLLVKEKKKHYEENEGYQCKQAFVGFMDDVPRRKHKCKIYVIKKRGFVHPIEIMPEMIELISAGIAVIHTADAYYVVSITSAKEPPVIFFSYGQPEIGKELVGDEIVYSKYELDVRHRETITYRIINILQVSDVNICYTYDKIYLISFYSE